MSCWGHSRPRILHLLSESAWYVRVRPLDFWDSHLMFKVFLSIEEKLEKGLKFPILKIFPQQSERCVAPWWWWWHSGIQHNWGKLGELWAPCAEGLYQVLPLLVWQDNIFYRASLALTSHKVVRETECSVCGLPSQTDLSLFSGLNNRKYSRGRSYNIPSNTQTV